MISPVLFHIYGPLSVHWYGVCIAIGAVIALYLMLHDKKTMSIASSEKILSAFHYILFGGVLGGRALALISEGRSFTAINLISFWEPGFSILGGIIGSIIMLIIFTKRNQIPILPFLDRLAIYAPLAQSFGRIGCFFAGCCHGIPTTHWFSVIYNDSLHMAPLSQSLVPSQLYSSALLFIIFMFLYCYIQHRITTPGLILCLYLLLSSIERFLIDFIRWDRIFITQASTLLSTHQWIALIISSCAIIAATIIYFTQKKQYGSV